VGTEGLADGLGLGRVAEGQIASADVGGRPFRMRISKIYPQVRNGAFEVDLQFIGQEPADLQRGQTVQIRLTLGDPTPALLIPNGAFYNETGGNWVFVVAPDGGSAIKRSTPGGSVRLPGSLTTTISPGESSVVNGVERRTIVRTVNIPGTPGTMDVSNVGLCVGDRGGGLSDVI